MEIKTTQSKPVTDDSFRIQDLWGMFLPRWHWFALSLVLTMSAASFYLLKTPNIYTRSASIMIKENSKGASAGGAAGSEFADLGMFKNNTNINNELFTISSPTLMSEVVQRLALNETYTMRQGLKRVQLYKNSPVAVMLADKETPVSFKIRLKSATDYELTDFMQGGAEVEETVSGRFNDSIRTPVGGMHLSLTHHYTDEAFAGKVISFSRSSVIAATDYYTASLNAGLGSQDVSIINLSISDASIQKAEDILNTLIEVYNEHWIQDKNQIAVSTSQFIGERLAVIENELGHVDENISSYKSEHLLPDVQAVSSLYLSESAENKKELLALNTQLSTAQFIRRSLTDKQIDQPLPSNSGIGSANIESQIGEYNQMVLDRNRLIANSSERNPLVKDLTNSMKSLRQTIIQSVDNHITLLNTQILSIRQREVATTKQLASNPNQAKYLLSVERQQKVKEELYLYLLQKREENELSQAFTAYNTRVITPPRGSAFPTAPNQKNILLVAFAIGLFVPAVIIFMMENMNTRVRGRKDLENMNVPFVGEIPLADVGKKSGKKRKNDTYEIVVKPHSRNIINEAFRVVRTNLEFMSGQDTASRVVMLSSMNPGSGKTFVTMNLATSFVIKDKRVAVVDLDMRRASLSSYVGKPKRGVANYLGGQVSDWREIVVKSGDRHIPDVLPVGAIPPNPSELLFSPKMEKLVSDLRQEYDLVFIDCPPVEIVADTSIIARWADMTLFLVRAGLMEREMLSVVDAYYTDRKFNNMALLLNGTTSAYGGRYGYHRYGYRYGYHYGYGNYSNE